MRRIVAIASAALIAVPLSIGAACVAEAASAHVSDGSPQIGGKKVHKKKEHREQGSSVAGIGPGDKPVEEGQDSVPDTNGLSTEDSPLGEDGPIGSLAR
jgi:hypothetical protein